MAMLASLLDRENRAKGQEKRQAKKVVCTCEEVSEEELLARLDEVIQEYRDKRAH